MKRTSALLLVSLFCVSINHVFADEGMNEIGDAFVRAFKANDLDGVVALYAEDAVSFPADTMAAQGKEQIRQSWGGLLNNFDVQDLIVSNAHHETSGDLSAAWGNFKMILLPKEGGDQVVMEGRFTDVARKIDGKWLYVADHASLPLPPPPEPAAK